MTVKNGSIKINNAKNISKITLGSAFISNPIVAERLGGTKARNLIGKFIKSDPISGNEINADFDF